MPPLILPPSISLGRRAHKPPTNLIIPDSDNLRVQVGMTWTDTRPTSTGDPFLSVLPRQSQHIQDFGAPTVFSPSAGSYNLAALVPYIQDMLDAGATRPHIIFCRAPAWSKPAAYAADGNDWSPDQAHRTDWAALCAAVVAYFDGRDSSHPLVEWYSYWNEMKGYYIFNTGDPGYLTNWAAYGVGPLGEVNRWHYERYTDDYNAVWAACKAVRSSIKLGGPYVIMESDSAGSSEFNFNGGNVVQKSLDVMKYFVQNATGFDFLSCDGGIENQHGTAIPSDPYDQIEKIWGFWNWVRNLGYGRGEATVPLINFETYIAVCRDAPWSYTKSQCDDLFIELLRLTKLNIPGEVTYMTWGHPLFYPQVVDDDHAFPSFAWSSPNVAASFKNRAATWNTTGAP